MIISRVSVIIVVILFFRSSARYHFRRNKTQKHIDLQEVFVSTKNGSFKGLEMETFSGARYYAFLGIPFAEPPIGRLRFKAPLPFKRFEDEPWDSTFERKPCLQYAFNSMKKLTNTKRLIFNNLAVGSEDCLYLNVYTPQLPNYLTYKLFPVMVWVHGGGFLIGGSQQSKYNPEHFINEGVLMVALNYRLGAFGFLTTEEIAFAPGNNGLRDQVVALKWIKDNIRYFCGDSKKITLFGQSAGAASISYLMQTRQAKGLFTGAIMQSGTSLCPWALSRESCPLEKYKKYKKLSAKKVLEDTLKETVQSLSRRSPINGLIYAPVNERNHSKSLFSGKSHEKLRTCEIENRVPILIGFNAREEDALARKIHFLQKLSPFLLSMKVKFNRMVKDLVPKDMKLDENKCDNQRISKLIREHYNITKNAMGPNTMHFIGDNVFIKPITEFAKLYSVCNDGTKTYLYEFVYDTHGVGHGDELPYLFTPNKNDSVYLTAKRLVKMWTNFAKTRNPTPSKQIELQNVVWPSTAESNDFSYLEIGRNLIIKRNPHVRDMAFWRRLYKKCGSPPFDTY